MTDRTPRGLGFVSATFLLIAFASFGLIALGAFIVMHLDVAPNAADPQSRIGLALIANFVGLLGVASGIMAVGAASGRRFERTLRFLQSKLLWMLGVYLAAAIVAAVIHGFEKP